MSSLRTALRHKHKSEAWQITRCSEAYQSQKIESESFYTQKKLLEVEMMFEREGSFRITAIITEVSTTTLICTIVRFIKILSSFHQPSKGRYYRSVCLFSVTFSEAVHKLKTIGLTENKGI